MSNTIKPSKELVTIYEPESAAAEAFRTLRTNLSLRNFDKELKVINIISASSKEAKTTTALNLAYVYSQLGKSVLVIDSDLRLPSVHKKLNIKNGNGLTNVVSGTCKFEDAVVSYTKRLDVLPSGTKIPFSSELVQSKRYKDLIEGCKQRYDIVIIDCPPINLVTDAMIISTYTDGTVMIVASNQVEKKELEHTKDLLNQFNVNVVGIVMTKMPIQKKYYNYDYGYGYTSEKKSKKK